MYSLSTIETQFNTNLALMQQEIETLPQEFQGLKEVLRKHEETYNAIAKNIQEFNTKIDAPGCSRTEQDDLCELRKIEAKKINKLDAYSSEALSRLIAELDEVKQIQSTVATLTKQKDAMKGEITKAKGASRNRVKTRNEPKILDKEKEIAAEKAQYTALVKKYENAINASLSLNAKVAKTSLKIVHVNFPRNEILTQKSNYDATNLSDFFPPKLDGFEVGKSHMSKRIKIFAAVANYLHANSAECQGLKLLNEVKAHRYYTWPGDKYKKGLTYENAHISLLPQLSIATSADRICELNPVINISRVKKGAQPSSTLNEALNVTDYARKEVNDIDDVVETHCREEAINSLQKIIDGTMLPQKSVALLKEHMKSVLDILELRVDGENPAEHAYPTQAIASREQDLLGWKDNDEDKFLFINQTINGMRNALS